MNRTDRLYALVEELRAVAPGRRTARSLAERFAVSVRTVERDLRSLQDAGVPIWAEPGRTGGYAIDARATLPPLGLTVDEALAVAIGLGTLRSSPFRDAARSAARKVTAVLAEDDARRTNTLARRVHLLETGEREPAPTALASALTSGRVVRMRYRDGGGAESEREVEPLGYIGKGEDWYLVAWCRLRDGVRAFRGDRVLDVELTDEVAPQRVARIDELDIPHGVLRPVLGA
ncbi:putative DNA-binding transcriptional regulator YafY [Curtobacterium flaccumfaciens]|uniref:Putative DNA-binding transcriptional regulator YafY n=1 Tax=Curtobacterium flaccumfaciens TaxID=2035 RepID=A0A4V3BKN8_9MICO|nr:YafY family protein [Curtobacterium flaccumfaciens]TDN43582.1 putative DNA-binding transcriptional regulator YafY [Curtobacterium flaccumfaciens]